MNPGYCASDLDDCLASVADVSTSNSSKMCDGTGAEQDLRARWDGFWPLFALYSACSSRLSWQSMIQVYLLTITGKSVSPNLKPLIAETDSPDGAL